MAPRFSVIIPARDEEAFIGRCLDSIAAAANPFPPGSVEVVVVLNRCTDGTEAIARRFGAVVVTEDGKNLARIRNAGAGAASGEILVTIDADSVMSPRTLTEIDRVMATGRYVGGGVFIVPERLSLGIIVTALLVGVVLAWHRVSVGLFFCSREDYDRIGGFDESLLSAEDIDFGRRLRRLGRETDRGYAHLFRAPIVTSCRKFDRFGDWYFLRRPLKTLALLKGRHREHADAVWYDFER